jgi:transposase
VESSHLTAHLRDAGQGRPTPRTPPKASAWYIQAHVRQADGVMGDHQHVQACGGLGTTISAREVSDPEVIAAAKSQSRMEGGLRLRKDPLLFVSAWLVKKPSRIAGLLMVMPLAWLVDSVTQRRLRQP